MDYDIIEMSCNNNAINVVPKYCSIVLKPNSNAVSCLKNSDNIKISTIDNNLIKIEAFGIASHAAHPEEGKNAITILIQMDKKKREEKTLVNIFNRKFWNKKQLFK